jgi:hypothetical protein
MRICLKKFEWQSVCVQAGDENESEEELLLIELLPEMTCQFTVRTERNTLTYAFRPINECTRFAGSINEIHGPSPF